MCFWKYLSTFCCCIGAYYVERYIFIKQIFLCRALTSMCHFSCLLVCPSTCCAPYLRNCASSNHNFWYTMCKMMVPPGAFFFFFWKFHIFILRISGTVRHMIVVFGTHLKWWYLQQFFFYFFKILIFKIVSVNT